VKFHYIAEHSGKLMARTLEAKDIKEAEQIIYEHYHKAKLVTPCNLINCSLPASELGLKA